jgi:hypothetical protein
MSLVALKRKTAAMQNLSSGQKGFSINGTHRSQGYIGQTSLSRSLINTPHGQTGAPEGHGGCCGDFSTTSNIRASETFSLEDENVVKKSVLSNTGMLSNRNRWLKRSAPYTSTKLTAGWTNAQGDYIAYLKKKAAKCDPTQIDKLLNEKEVNSVAISKCTTTNITRKDGAPVFNKTTVCTFTKPVSDYTSISQGEHIFKLHDKCADQDDVLFKIVSNTRRTPLLGLTTNSSPPVVEPVVPNPNPNPGPDLPIPRWIGVGNNAGNPIAYKDGDILSSNLWTSIADSSGGKVFNTEGVGVAYANGVWVAVGGQVNLTGSPRQGNTIATSNDGLTWTTRGKIDNINIIDTNGRGVAYGNYLWVVVGGGSSDSANSIATSDDNGVSWTGQGNNKLGLHGRAVAYGNNMWVAVGIGGANTIATSSNGIEWTGQGNTYITSGNANNGGLSVAYGKDNNNNNLWIVGGGRTTGSTPIGNTLATSTNGTVWNGVSSSPFTTAVNGVAYGKDNLGGNLWVAVGSGTYSIATSTNGTVWNGVSSSPFNTGRSVMYVKSWHYQDNDYPARWVATGSGTNTTIATSIDGINWVGGGVPVFSDRISSTDDRGFDIAFNR